MSDRNRHYRVSDAAFDLIPPEPQQRLKTEPPAMRDVSDAEFVIIDGPMARRHNHYPANSAYETRSTAPILVEPSGTMTRILKILAMAARMFEALLGHLSTRAFAALTITATISVFWLLGGFAAFMPGSNLATAATPRPPLAILAVSGHIESDAGMSVLIVTGAVENTTTKALNVPEMRVDVANDGQTAQTTQTARIAAPQRQLGPGQTAAFSVRLNHPGGKVPQIRVSFPENAGNVTPL